VAGSVQLRLGGAFDDTWREVARPWLADAARQALVADRPWVVLAPSRAWHHALKARLVAEGLHLGGVFFWTPGELRDHLRRQLPDPLHIAVREHLHLLLASVAEEADAGPAREPARLMRSLDQLSAAGLDARALDFPPAEQLALRFQTALRAAGWTTVQALDWSLSAQPPPAALASLLLLGFDAAHWELWPLLNAAARSAGSATAVLTAPRSKAEQLDQAWIGTWEQSFGEAEPIPPGERAVPYAALAHRMENPEGDTGRGTAPALDVLIGRQVREQAEAIVAQCLDFLARPDATRVGVLFPGPDPLCREVSAQLLRRGLPHFNAFGHVTPPSAVALRWRAWIALQRSYQLEPLQRLLALDPRAALTPDFHRAVERAAADVLVDDLPVLAARLHDSGREQALAAARVLTRYERLPAEATLSAFRTATRQAWQRLEWPDLLAELEPQLLPLAALDDRPLARGAWLDWIESVAPAPGPAREADAANPLACLHLLSYAHAEGLPWSHLILTDLNEGRWPPAFDPAGFLGDERIAEINRDALRQGDQGEGHVTAKPGRALLLGASERREIFRRQFYNLVESAGAGLAVTCALESEEASGRLSPASDFLSHLYFTAFGTPLTERRMEALHGATARWLATVPPPPRLEPPTQPSDAAQAGHAFRARRAPVPFGPYECAFAAAPPRPALLSCKEWERAVRDPAARWLAAYLGVEAAGDFGATDHWPVTCGTWVHRWLAHALCDTLGRLEPRARGADLATRVRQAVRDTHRVLGRAFAAAGRAEPQWWRARVAHAEWMALQFARRLATLKDWPLAAAEWTLPKPAAHLGKAGRLELRGRIDALFAQEMADGLPARCWVVDFKTGNEKALSAKTLANRLRDGYGVQIGLYALALAAAGAREVAVSLLTPDAAMAPQVDLAALKALDPFWDELVRMQNSGVFGVRGQMRAEYGPSLELPLATLAVDPDVLEEKWALTHPGLAAQEASDEA
jgi:hypothetical protein